MLIYDDLRARDYWLLLQRQSVPWLELQRLVTLEAPYWRSQPRAETARLVLNGDGNLLCRCGTLSTGPGSRRLL